MRMFGPKGNPQARNLFEIIGHLQKRKGLHFELRARTLGPLEAQDPVHAAAITRLRDRQKFISPMPGAPPPGMDVSFFGFSATIASVATRMPAREAASCRAVRTTLVGSTMPAFGERI